LLFTPLLGGLKWQVKTLYSLYYLKTI